MKPLMKMVMKSTLLVVLVVLTIAPAYSQTGAGRRLCTVNLVGGEFVRGYFVGASSRSVTVEVNGARKIIRLDRVTNILFIVDFKNRKAEEREN
ncbi:MAG TPA: hypothetical protein VF723_06610 [Pyrinomonadaceae bacterium]|jgi:hypothetical protein